jgi:vacuolar iron transporter family protein
MNRLLVAQQNELTEHYIYRRLAERTKDPHNKKVLLEISDDELRHHDYIRKLTKVEVEPDMVKVAWYTFVSKIFGLAFGLKLMENGEGHAALNYTSIKEVAKLAKEETAHEDKLLSMLKEERVEYAGSIVLGLNDALVELTGALAGLTFVINNPRLIAMTGMVTGIAASLSMAASDYLSSKEEEDRGKNALKSALYTGVAYILTVALLIMPYLFGSNIYLSLAVMLSIALTIIFVYTFYITTAKSLPFWRRFLEMAAISITVAAISFCIGFLIKSVFHVDI